MRSRLLVLILFNSLGVLAAQVTNSVSATGYITDTLSGRSGATALNVESAKRNIASGKAKYAIYDEATKKLYILEPQDAAVAYLGQRVKITGTVSTTPLTRAGQVLVPAAVAGTAQDMPVTLNKALDVSTPIAGVLTISSVDSAPAPPKRRQALGKPKGISEP